jgi:hypothetical protein
MMPVANKYNVAKSLRLKGWKLLAKHYHDDKKHIDATVAFNNARQVTLSDEDSIKGLFNSLMVIYDEHKNYFSREDMILLDNRVSRLVSFYTIHLPVERSSIDEGEK